MMELDGRPITPDELGGLALYNYGHFTSMKVEDLRVRGLSFHLERLVRDCRTLFAADLDPESVRNLVRRAAESVASPVIVRVTVFDPDLNFGCPGGQAEPHVLVSVRPAATVALPPLRLQSVCYRRDLPTVKHVGLFKTTYHRRAAQLDGFDDALFTDVNSCVSEGATWNIGLFDGSRVIWPESDVLAGVTMRLLKDVIRKMKVASATAAVNISQLSEIQAVFATNAAVGVRPIRSIDDVELSDDLPIIKALQESYAAMPGELL